MDERALAELLTTDDKIEPARPSRAAHPPYQRPVSPDARRDDRRRDARVTAQHERRRRLRADDGHLHEGHSRWRRGAQRQPERCRIFVNPAQFGPGEDAERYPRDAERDLCCCATSASMSFMPPAEEMYPMAHRRRNEVEGITDVLEGAHGLGTSRRNDGRREAVQHRSRHGILGARTPSSLPSCAR
jgi:hypothetical protein